MSNNNQFDSFREAAKDCPGMIVEVLIGNVVVGTMRRYDALKIATEIGKKAIKVQENVDGAGI